MHRCLERFRTFPFTLPRYRAFGAGAAVALLAIPGADAVQAQSAPQPRIDGVPCAVLPLAERPRAVPEGADWRRSIELLGSEGGSWLVRRGVRPSWISPGGCDAANADPERSGFEILPATLTVGHNSAYPRKAHDGPRWQGRGTSGLAAAGVAWSGGPISFGLQPLAAWQENQDFDFVPASAAALTPFANPWHSGIIDWPQRFGEQSYWTVTPGQTFLRADVGAAAAGISTENLWWGPALRNPLLMGSAAPGFPHVFLGTGRPLDVGIGRVEAELIWGWLRESEYFDRRPENDRRQFSGVVIAFTPDVLPGFHIGAARSFLTTIPEDGMRVSEFLLGPFSDLGLNLEENQLASIFGRIAPPGSGFEAYAEWAREDWWSTISDLIQEPDHSRAYTLGLQQVVVRGPRVVRLFGEVAHLGASAATTQSGRGASTFYTHSAAVQGYTHRGQLLGTPIGPGSDAQAIGVDLLAPGWEGGLLLERVRYQNDAYYQRWAFLHDFRGHDVELTGALTGGTRWNDLHVRGTLGYSRRTSRGFLGLEDPAGNFRIEGNWLIELDLGWRPSGR